MNDWKERGDKLDVPFALDDIEFRIGSINTDKTKGMLLAYVANRAIQQRLDDVFGKGGWYNEFIRWSPEKGNICILHIYDPDSNRWIGKQDGSDDSDMEAFKGGLSNAMKRAAVQWGIGRYLYDLPTWWVSIEPRGKSYYPVKGEIERVKSGFPLKSLPLGSLLPPPPADPPAKNPENRHITALEIKAFWGTWETWFQSWGIEDKTIQLKIAQKILPSNFFKTNDKKETAWNLAGVTITQLKAWDTTDNKPILAQITAGYLQERGEAIPDNLLKDVPQL